MKFIVSYDPLTLLVGLQFECAGTAQAEALFAKLVKQAEAGHVDLDLTDAHHDRAGADTVQ